jgi:DNA-binding response OmpR family regulator
MVKRGLTVHGHHVLVATTGEDGLLVVRTEPLDLILLDILLPGQDGHQVLAGIRRLDSNLPVVMLTARDDLGSKVSALDGGADDYITKPFLLEELLARIRALRRRTDRQPESSMVCGDLRVDLLSHRVWRGDQPVTLSRREFALLEYFVRNQGRLLPRQQILTDVWEHDFEGESNVVDVYVRYLRAKLDRPGQPSLIAAVRGVGYRFEAPSNPA